MKAKNTFDLRIMSPWPVDLKDLYTLINGYGNKINLRETPELTLKGANKHTIEQLKKFGVRYEVLENDKTSMAEPLIEEHISDHVFPEVVSDNHLDVIIQTPFPYDVTAQGKRFWEIMGYYAKSEDTQASYQPIVIFNMLRTHYEELMPTSALISEYVFPEECKPVEVNPEPVEEVQAPVLCDMCKLEMSMPDRIAYSEPEEPIQKEFRFGFTVGKLKIEAITKNPSASMEQMVYDTLLAIGCSSSQAAEYVKFAYTPREEFFEKGLKLDINFNEFPDIFAVEAEFKIKL